MTLSSSYADKAMMDATYLKGAHPANYNSQANQCYQLLMPASEAKMLQRPEQRYT